MIRLSASTNPCPEDKLVDYVKLLQDLKVDYMHCDVMNDNFVGRNCLPIELIRDIKENSLIPLDVHLMVNEPLNIIKQYCKIGVMYITVHYEAFENKQDLIKAISLIRKYNTLVGLSIKPKTRIEDIGYILPLVDLVLIMSVEPGKSGQKILSNAQPKIRQLKEFITEKGYDIKIEVDGGINMENVEEIAMCGADIVVMGSEIYKSNNKTDLIKKIHKIK